MVGCACARIAFMTIMRRAEPTVRINAVRSSGQYLINSFNDDFHIIVAIETVSDTVQQESIILIVRVIVVILVVAWAVWQYSVVCLARSDIVLAQLAIVGVQVGQRVAC